MNENLIPISTLFVGINGFIAFVLSYIVAMERTKIRVWHGESQEDVIVQPNYLEKPNKWAAFFENLTQKLVETKNFQKKLARVLKTPWLMATSDDCRWETTEGGKPDKITRLIKK
ncbi:MAG: hypothetical protein AAF915_27375 [Cyanobacteria bacterium P01_D01_bin.50]